AALRGDLALRRGVGDAAARRRDRVPDARRGPARGRADRVPAPGDRAVVVGGAVTGKLLTFRRPGAAPTGSDAALLAACAVGDAGALGALFDLYHAEVERFIGRLAWCPAAELGDLVQNTFIEVRRAARRFEGKSTVRTWIFSIAVNVARRHARGERRRRSLI